MMPIHAIIGARGGVLRTPVRVYLLSFPASPRFDSTLGTNQVRELIGEVNRIWRPAGISWTLQSVVPTSIDQDRLPPQALLQTGAEFRERLAEISPQIPEVVGRRLWRVVILRTFPILAGGAYLPRTRTAFFCQETRRGETSPVVLAHELGHSLGLTHVPEPANLMHPAAGARGNPEDSIGLTPEQIAQARIQVEHGPKGVEEGRRLPLR